MSTLMVGVRAAEFDIRPGFTITRGTAEASADRTQRTRPLPTSTDPAGPRRPYASPANYHRHVTIDGRVIEHHDSNFGNPAAHYDVRSPWPKYYGNRAPDVRR